MKYRIEIHLELEPVKGQPLLGPRLENLTKNFLAGHMLTAVADTPLGDGGALVGDICTLRVSLANVAKMRRRYSGKLP